LKAFRRLIDYRQLIEVICSLMRMPPWRHELRSDKGGVNMEEKEIVILDSGIDEEMIVSDCCRANLLPFHWK